MVGLERTPRLYLGTMTFAWSQTSSRVDDTIASEMLRLFAETTTAPRIDTARIYAGGKTEGCVGTALSMNQGGAVFSVGTKAHPSQPGGLSRSGIQTQFEKSKEVLQAKANTPVAFGEYYLHQPDTEHSLLESLQTLHQYKVDGLIEEVGMSNYHASEMERAFGLCKEHALTPPTVYQGLYNPLNRMVEQDLLPVLRKNNCAFVAYNPLAAGLLTGKYTDEQGDVPKGRFRNNQNYLPRFYTRENFSAVSLLLQACEANGISLVEATFRWLLCHSQADGVLLGASSIPQLQQNLAACSEPKPLSEDLVKAFDEAWAMTSSAGVFPYWRSYSADMPNRAALDQGASYEASKK